MRRSLTGSRFQVYLVFAGKIVHNVLRVSIWNHGDYMSWN